MVLWMNNVQARNRLLKYGRVYTLRPKPHRGKDKKTKGTDVLMYDVRASRGKVSFVFLKKINRTNELIEYVAQSGFLSVEEWLKAAGKSRNLYLVKLIEG